VYSNQRYAFYHIQHMTLNILVSSLYFYHHGMARPQVADGGDALKLWRKAANILNKQSRTADKGWSSSLGVGCGANNSSRKK
jgi:hypothetical protein